MNQIDKPNRYTFFNDKINIIQNKISKSTDKYELLKKAYHYLNADFCLSIQNIDNYQYIAESENKLFELLSSIENDALFYKQEFEAIKKHVELIDTIKEVNKNKFKSKNLSTLNSYNNLIDSIIDDIDNNKSIFVDTSKTQFKETNK